MTRRTAPMLLVALLLSSPAWAYVHRESVEKAIPAEGVSAIRVSDPNGLIRVRPGAESVIALEAKKVARAKGEDAARELAAEARVRVVEGSDIIEIKVEIPSRVRHSSGIAELLGLSRRRHVSVDLYLEVPRSMEVILTTASGDIDVEGMRSGGEINATSGDVWLSDCKGDFTVGVASGDVDIDGVVGELNLSAASGELSVRDVRGPVEVSVASGDFEGSGIDGPFSLDGASGSVNLEDCGEEINVNTASGDIWLNDVSAMLSVSTSSGDVTASAASGGAVDVSISCSSGDIELTLAKGGSFELEISSVSGAIYTKVPLSIESVSRHELRGVVGSGAGSVTLSTSSGDIRLYED